MAENHVDYGVVKKPHNDKPLTQWEEQEWIKCALDPWYFFSNYCYVIGPSGKILFDARDYQIDMVDEILNNRFVIINAPRQTGKCIGKDTKYTVRSKKAGETYELTAEEFHAMVKSQRDSKKRPTSTTYHSSLNRNVEVQHKDKLLNVIHEPSETISRKFEEVINVSEWEVLSHDGWRDIHSSNMTIPYDVYLLTLENGMTLECADDHIIITDKFEEVFVKDSIGHSVITVNGGSSVVSVRRKKQTENMYDLSVSGDHLYYTDGILSHNTALMALMALHEITFTPDITTGVTSFKLTNVRDILKRLKYSYESLPEFLKAPVTVYNASEVSFTNHSSVYGEVTSESALRGKTVTGTAIVDEFAFTDPAIAHEFITSFLPALEAAGEESTTKVVIISTPNSSTGKYAEIVNGAIDGSNGWVYHKVDPTRIPGRTEEWEIQMVKKLGINRFKQEFEGHFLSDNSSLINSSVIEAITHKEPVREIGDLKIYVDSFKDRKLVIGVDVSEGVGKDNSCFQVFDIDSLEQVAEFADNMMNQTQYFKKIVRTFHLFAEEGADLDSSFVGVESNGMGNGILRLIESSEDPVLTRVMMINDVDRNGIATGKPGLTTTNNTKLDGCGVLKDMVEEGKLTLRSQQLLNELRMFTKQGATFKAERGAKDDRVMAVVIVMNMLKQIANYEDNIYEVMNEVSLDTEEDFSDIFF